MLTVVSGADGSGKSTIINSYVEQLIEDDVEVNKYWLRFVSIFSKAVNMLGRILKKSYVENHKWGKIGYHDYDGYFGYIYIVACYLDHLMFFPIFMFRNRKSINNTKVHHIYDRYLVDTVADLIVDTGKDEFILWLFSGLVSRLKHKAKIVIITCDEKVVISRRLDIYDDKKYKLRLEAFNKIATKYKIKTLDTSEGTIKENMAGLK
jgi:GTPase SAR1 family protein